MPAPASLPPGVSTAKEIESLNPHSYNPSKATKLLESVGFRKVGGKWQLPDGKPFTATIISPNFTDDEFVYKTFSDWLTGFGIPTQEEVISSTVENADQANGNFEMIGEYRGVFSGAGETHGHFDLRLG